MDTERDPSLYKSAYSRKNLEFVFDEEKLRKEYRYKLKGNAFPQKPKRWGWLGWFIYFLFFTILAIITYFSKKYLP